MILDTHPALAAAVERLLHRTLPPVQKPPCTKITDRALRRLWRDTCFATLCANSTRVSGTPRIYFIRFFFFKYIISWKFNWIYLLEFFVFLSKSYKCSAITINFCAFTRRIDCSTKKYISRRSCTEREDITMTLLHKVLVAFIYIYIYGADLPRKRVVKLVSKWTLYVYIYIICHARRPVKNVKWSFLATFERHERDRDCYTLGEGGGV